MRACSSGRTFSVSASRYGWPLRQKLGLRTYSTASFGVYLTSLNGPVPMPSRAGFSCWYMPCGTIGEYRDHARYPNSVASGLLRWIRSLYLLSTSVLAIFGNCPRTETLPGSGGFACRSKEYLQSSAVTSLPLWNLTPFLSVKSTVLLSITFHDSASAPRMLRLRS